MIKSWVVKKKEVRKKDEKNIEEVIMETGTILLFILSFNMIYIFICRMKAVRI